MDSKAAKVVVPSSGLTGKGKVFKEGSITYDAYLNIKDASKNMAKFYRMQLVESTDKCKYWFVQHWGRIGTSGQTQVKGPTTKGAAVKLMEQKFKQKSGKSWDQRHLAGRGTADSSAKGGRGTYELPDYGSAPSAAQTRKDIETASTAGGVKVQHRYEAQQFARLKCGVKGSCMKLHHGPGAPGCCKTMKHSWHFWLCHRCSTVQYWAACVFGCDWGTFGWTCIEPKCKPNCGCKKKEKYWKKHGRNWLVVKKQVLKKPAKK